MSTESSLDPQLIEQTKQQIRTLVNEIADLSKSDVGPDEFYTGFLPRVVQALAAIGGVVWAFDEQNRLGIAYQINLQETRLRDRPDDQVRHGRLIQSVLKTGQGVLVPPHSGSGDDAEASNPTDFLLVLGALRTDIETIGVVEVFQRPEAGPTTQKGYLRFLLQMCDLAGDYFKSRQIRHFADRQVLWTQLEEFSRLVHANLDPRETAYTIANEGRRLIECDRVSVAIRKGKKCTIESVSGQDMVDKRSNTVRLLGNLATAVVASGETVWYTGDTTDMAPQVEDAVQEYVDESHTKTLAVIPLVRARKDPEEEEASLREDVEVPVGALIVEQIEDSRVPEKMIQRTDVVAKHSATALANSLEHNNLFLMPLWRTIGRQRWVLKARTLPKTLAITGAILAVLVWLAVWPADFTLRAKGTLEPVKRRDVFAPFNAVVKEIPEGIEHGMPVKKGQVVLILSDTELTMKQAELKGEEDTTLLSLRTTLRQINEGSGKLTAIDVADLQGKAAELKQKLISLGKQREIYAEKIEKLKVRSPIDGVVVTWDLQNRLRDRPVQTGASLMRIADPAKDWRLELEIPENRMGHIARARQEVKQDDPKKDLSVEYILALQPGKRREGTIASVGESAEVKGEEGNTVLITVNFTKTDLADMKKELEGAMRPGAGVNAKVKCGTRAIGYVWFHDAIEYFQSRVVFPWF